MKQTKDFFALYDLAKELKEIGFNEPCLGVFDYDNDDGYLPKDILTLVGGISTKEGATYLPDDIRNSLIGSDISAPTYDQVVDWFEQTHGIYIGKMGYNDGFTPKRFTYYVNQDYCQEQSMAGAVKQAIKLVKESIK